MEYEIVKRTIYETATPRGLQRVEFEAGIVEPGDDSDERFVIETVLIPSGLAKQATRKAKDEKAKE